MEAKTIVSATAFCQHHHIDLSFIHSLSEYGLIEMSIAGEDFLLNEEQLTDLEKMVRLHYDLQINLEGIEAIYHLIHKMEGLQQELYALQAKLRIYE